MCQAGQAGEWLTVKILGDLILNLIDAGCNLQILHRN